MFGTEAGIRASRSPASPITGGISTAAAKGQNRAVDSARAAHDAAATGRQIAQLERRRVENTKPIAPSSCQRLRTLREIARRGMPDGPLEARDDHRENRAGALVAVIEI
jgi:hypothetical protein